MLRRSSENIESPGSEVAEVTLKRPRKSEEVSILKKIYLYIITEVIFCINGSVIIVQEYCM